MLVAKSEVLNCNNLSKSKEDAISGRSVVKRRTGRGQTGSQGNRVLRVWLMRERERERSQVEEPDEELEVGDSLEGNKLDSSEANKLDCSKLKDISDFSDSSGFQEMSSSLLNKQEWVGTGGVSRVLNFLVEKTMAYFTYLCSVPG